MLHSGHGYLLCTTWMTRGGDLERSEATYNTLYALTEAIRGHLQSCKEFGCDTPIFRVWEFQAKAIKLDIGSGPLITFSGEPASS